MKKSYIKIFIFELLTLLILIANSFESSILNLYKMPIFLLVLSLIFILMLGIEKDNKREKKEVIFDISMGSVIYILLFYILGIIIGFARNVNYLNMYGIVNIILPLILTIIFKEFLRRLLLTKSGDNLYLIILTTFLFIMVDLSSGLHNLTSSSYEAFKYISLYILPSISLNIFLTYCTKSVSYIVSIIYCLITGLFIYILPIIPNPTPYLKSIIDLLVPVIFFIRVRHVANKFKIEDTELGRNKQRKRYFEIAVLSCLVMFLVYFISGYFKYYAVAIASNSMKPVFERGSVVILEQVDKKYNNLKNIKEGDIIAFNKENIVIVHRIIKIIEIDGERFYYTKGDNNNFEDKWKIEEKDIIGIVKLGIPFIGYPTVKFSEL